MKKLLAAAVLGLSVLTLTACGQKSSESSTSQSSDSDKTTYPLTIKNYSKKVGSDSSDPSWPESTQTFTHAPTKVVANTRPMAELLLHLGLEKSIAGVGAVFGEKDESVEASFDKLKNLGNSYISQETALSVDPDFVFGRGGLFEKSEWGVGTVESLNEMKIPTYIMETSIKGGTFDSIYNDIDNLGKIFDVESAADKFKKEIQDREDALKETVKDVKETQTFAYIHSNDPSEINGYSLSGDTFASSLFDMLKLKEAYDVPTGTVSIEKIIEANPDIIIIPKWDDTDNAEKMVAGLYTSDKVSSLKAIKNKKVYILNYNYLFGYSYQSLAGFEEFAKVLYPELAK
ncbi:ABC transporter substrate-binding protein [Streptococcaceae bacterium ESL0687]|nr:ABC transporter substrate-binding protein [Streptococcaceae bacterium ESL0687]